MRFIGIEDACAVSLKRGNQQLDQTDLKNRQKSTFLDVLDEWEFLIAPIIFTALAFFTRMWRIGLSNIVTWDEAQ